MKETAKFLDRLFNGLEQESPADLTVARLNAYRAHFDLEGSIPEEENDVLIDEEHLQSDISHDLSSDFKLENSTYAFDDTHSYEFTEIIEDIETSEFIQEEPKIELPESSIEIVIEQLSEEESEVLDYDKTLIELDEKSLNSRSQKIQNRKN